MSKRFVTQDIFQQDTCITNSLLRGIPLSATRLYTGSFSFRACVTKEIKTYAQCAYMQRWLNIDKEFGHDLVVNFSKVIKRNSVESLRTCWICIRRLMGLMLWPPSPPCSPFFTSTCYRKRSTWESAFPKNISVQKQSLELLTLPQVTTRLHLTR